jgi:hypothetical protein
MGCQHDVSASQGELPRLDRERIVRDVFARRLLEHEAAVAIDDPCEMRQILARMKLGLPCVRYSRAPGSRDFVEVHRVELELFGQDGFVTQPLPVAVALRIVRLIAIAGHPGPLAGNVLVAHRCVELLNGRKSGIPGGLGMVPAEGADEIGQVQIRDCRQVRSRVHRVDAAHPRPLDDGHRVAGAFQKIGGRQAGDAGADDYHIDVDITVEHRIARHRGRLDPVRSSDLCHGSSSILSRSKPSARAEQRLR